MEAMDPFECGALAARAAGWSIGVVDDLGDRSGGFIDQQVVAIIATHPMGSMDGFVQVFDLPVLNNVTIVAIFSGYDAAFLVPGGVGAADMLHGGRRGFGGLNGAALIVGLRCHRCTGYQ